MNQRLAGFLSALFIMSLFYSHSLVASTQPLAVSIDDQQVSVSGVSSGAYMAIQLHIAYSDIFMGVGSIAGGPYYCAEDWGPEKIDGIKLTCMMGLGADVTAKKYIDAARKADADGTISPLANLKDDKIYLFNSQSDQVINPLLGLITKTFYKDFVESSASQIEAWAFIPQYGPFYPVAHGMPTDNKLFDKYQNIGNLMTPCSPSNSQQYSWFPNQFLRGNDPWMYHCDMGWFSGYNLAADILSQMYGHMKRNQPADLNRMYSFSQLDYVGIPAVTTQAELHAMGLGDHGYVYVPENCEGASQACRLHVALHGCQMFPEWTFTGKVGSQFAGQTVTFNGLYRDNVYNEVAEANDIIMLYPQAINIGTQDSDINPYGCWEFWPFVDANIATYFTRDAPQMKFIANVIAALQSGTLNVEAPLIVAVNQP